MKTLKISMVALVALVLAIGASAFSTQQKSSRSEGWFKLNNTSQIGDVASYSYYGTEAPCEGNDMPCAIFGERDAVNPSQPTEASLEYALEESDEFDHAVIGVVAFEGE